LGCKILYDKFKTIGQNTTFVIFTLLSKLKIFYKKRLADYLFFCG